LPPAKELGDFVALGQRIGEAQVDQFTRERRFKQQVAGQRRAPGLFAAALHTYLGVSDVTLVRLQGLDGCRFHDCLLGGEAIEDHPEKRFHGEIDRIYEKATSLLLRDGPRRLAIESDNLPDAVIWNPGPEKCAEMKDMPAADWQSMLCVEAARIIEPITLGPDESWSGRQTLVLLSA